MLGLSAGTPPGILKPLYYMYSHTVIPTRNQIVCQMLNNMSLDKREYIFGKPMSSAIQHIQYVFVPSYRPITIWCKKKLDKFYSCMYVQ